MNRTKDPLPTIYKDSDNTKWALLTFAKAGFEKTRYPTNWPLQNERGSTQQNLSTSELQKPNFDYFRTGNK